MKRITCTFLAALVVATLGVGSVSAGDFTPNPPNPHVMKGTILKFSQPIQHVVDPSTQFHELWGEDIWSDFDWKKVMDPNQSPTAPLPPNWIIADDFQDPFDTPVRTVRWWGSYDNETFHQDPATGAVTPISGPGSEDGYVISFFRDIPAGVGNVPFSRPGPLLGTYVLPFEKVWWEPTDYLGYDDKEIFEYKANLMDAHLDHPSDLADPMGFNQRPDEIYWISIAAFVGHKPVLVEDADGTTRWEVEETNKFGDLHYWGWHTSPFNLAPDVAAMGHLFMPPDSGQWIYPQELWRPVEPLHHLPNMAFELYTIPEPASVALLALGVAGMLGIRRRD